MDGIDKRIFVKSTADAWKGGMDKDTDPRYIANGSYINARNVTFMNNGSRYVLSNMKGNTQQSYTLNTGDNICIGSYDDKANQTVYAFIWNSGNDHEIIKYRYALTNNNIVQVAEGSGLNFNFNFLITGVVVVNSRFLIWAQQENEIGCIDLDNSPADEAITITDDNRWRVELNKIPDLSPLRVQYVTDENRKENNIFGTAFQFRYVYIYEGGFRSPMSTISGVPVPDFDFTRFGGQNEEFYDNAISVQIPQPTFDKVEKIEVFVRYEQDDTIKDSQIWYKFATVDYDLFNADQDELSVVFTGNETLEGYDPTEALTETTFFPKVCKDVEFLPSNVMGFFNFTDNLDVSGVNPECEIWPEYEARPTTNGTTTTTATYSNSNTSDVAVLKNPNFNISLTTTDYDTITIGGTPAVGDTITVSLVLSYSGTSPTTFSNRTVEYVYVVKEEDLLSTAANNRATVANKLTEVINSIDTRFDGFGGIVAIQNTAVVRLYQGINDNNSPYNVTTSVTSSSTASVTRNLPLSTLNYRLYRSVKTFKRWATHPFAVQYMDEKGRRSDAIPIGKGMVEGYDLTTNDGWVNMNIAIGHLAPIWATQYAILRGNNTTYERFLQLPVEGDHLGSSIRFNVPESITEFRDASYDTDAYQFSFVEGDRLRVIGELGEGNQVRYYTDIIDFPITYDDDTFYGIQGDADDFVTGEVYTGFDVTYANPSQGVITKVGSPWGNLGFLEGQKITVTGGAGYSGNDGTYEIASISGQDLEIVGLFSVTAGTDTGASFTRTSIVSGGSPAFSQHIVEVWRPKKDQSKLFYEVAFQGTIDANRRHSGNVNNQSASSAAILSLGAGDSYSVYAVHPSFNITGTSSLYEFQSMSAAYNARVTDIGRSNYDTPTDEEVTREAAVTWTQPIIANSSSNGLSVVLSTNVKTYDLRFGSIQKTALLNNKQLIVYFEDKVGQVGVLEELQKQSGGDITYQTTALFNGINYYSYDGGIGLNPESFSYYDTTQYFVCARNNAICRLANNGITEISKYGMTSFYNEELDVKSKFLPNLKAFGVYDERNESYIVSFRSYINTEVSNPQDGTTPYALTLDLTAIGGYSPSNIGNIVYLFDASAGEWVKVSFVSLTAVGSDSLQIQYFSGPLPSSVSQAFLVYTVDTAMFNEPANSWVSFLDFQPDFMATCGVDFVSFKDGNTWLHNSNETRGSYYGTEFDAEVTVPFNKDPSIVKMFYNIEQETNDPWISETDGDVYTPAGQTSQIFDDWYSQTQPNQYDAWLGKDTSTPTALVPTDKVHEGFDLRDTVLIIRMTQDSTSEVKLSSVTIKTQQSNINS